MVGTLHQYSRRQSTIRNFIGEALEVAEMELLELMVVIRLRLGIKKFMRIQVSPHI